MVPTIKNKLPVVGLGARRQCPRGWTWNQQGNFCEQTSGGGSNRIKRIMPLYGTAAPATPKTQNETVNDVVTDPFGTKTESGSFDIMQFISDNALWLGLGAAGLLAIFLFSKKRR